MDEYLIIDGYNVINSWEEFSELRRENMEHAREIFTAAVAEYAAFKGYRAIVVFDAQEMQGDGSVIQEHNIEVVFTDGGETADSWIERRIYELNRGPTRVFVVTSDYAEQINVLWAGAYRISSREFYNEYQDTKKEISKKLQYPKRALNRNELGERLRETVLEHFEKLRRR